MNFRSFGISVAVAAVAMTVLASIPVVNLGNCLCGAWQWAPAIAAVWLYMRLTPQATLTAGQGVVIGAAAGLIATALLALFLGGVVGAGSAWMEVTGDEMVEGGLLDTLTNLMAIGPALSCVLGPAAPVIGGIGGWVGVQLFGRPEARGVYPGRIPAVGETSASSLPRYEIKDKKKGHYQHSRCAVLMEI